MWWILSQMNGIMLIQTLIKLSLMRVIMAVLIFPLQTCPYGTAKAKPVIKLLLSISSAVTVLQVNTETEAKQNLGLEAFFHIAKNSSP